jgi:hypothetical protein
VADALARAPRAWHHGSVLSGLLAGYQAIGETETADLERMTLLAATTADPWSRSLPLHFTASALVVHPETRRVLLRWHNKHDLWLQVGGHGDPGESDPLRIALREAAEETGHARPGRRHPGERCLSAALARRRRGQGPGRRQQPPPHARPGGSAARLAMRPRVPERTRRPGLGY